MLVRHIKRECEVRAELLKASPTLGTGAVRIDHAANRCRAHRRTAPLELRNSAADLGDATDNLVARNNRIHSGHKFAPLIPHGVKIRVANTAEQYFDLYVVFGWFAPRDRAKGERRCRAGSGVSFGVSHVLNLDDRRVLRYAKHAVVHANYASNL